MEQDMSNAALRLKNLRLAYGEIDVVTALNLTVAAGEIVALLGPSGCGKSSVLRAIAGFLAPVSGSIELSGQDVDGPPEKRGVGMVFQDFALFNHLSVRANIGFGLHRHEHADERVDELLERCSLTRFADRLPAELSGGQQQRVGLARALAPRPKLLLLDEPFANLDRALRDELAAWCKEQILAEGAAAILVTHDRHEAMALCDRIAIVDGSPGRLLQVGPARDLYQKPDHEAVARMTGEALLVPARASGQRARSALGEHDLWGPSEGSVTLVIRPEQIEIRADAQGDLILEGHYFDAERWQHQLRYDGHRFKVALDQPIDSTRLSLTTTTPIWAIPS